MSTQIYNPGSGFRPGSGYGPRPSPTPGASTYHRGIDFPAATGTPIPAAADGKVYASKSLPGYGNTIVIEHTINGVKVYTLYGHLDQPSPLKKGDVIHQGDSVGVVGNTGRGTGPHLHFEIIKDQPSPLKKGHETYNPNDFDFAPTGTLPDSIIGSIGEILVVMGNVISTTVTSIFTRALNWRPPRDPLVLDLDGITTTPINPNAPLLFDQDGDGTLTATGWIGAGEALVVRDLNGNGLIDSGRELFGDSTVLTSGTRIGQKAANGFEALADLDSNADGQFDAADTAFTSVQLWKDANQNGISEAGELFSLNDLGVASINVAGSASNLPLLDANGQPTGNTQPLSGTFTRTSGQTGNAGVAELAGSLLLANNAFYREFTDDPVVTSAAAALPQMRGSGWVRRCGWSRRRDAGVTGRKEHAMNKGAASARQMCGNDQFRLQSTARVAECIVDQAVAKNWRKSKCTSFLFGSIKCVEVA